MEPSLTTSYDLSKRYKALLRPSAFDISPPVGMLYNRGLASPFPAAMPVAGNLCATPFMNTSSAVSQSQVDAGSSAFATAAAPVADPKERMAGEAAELNDAAPPRPAAPRPTFEEKLASLQQSRQLASQVTPSVPADEEVSNLREQLRAEREQCATLRKQVDGARQAEEDRGEELMAALAALKEVRKQVTNRTSECAHWRAEAARAVGRLEALTEYAHGPSSSSAPGRGSVHPTFPCLTFSALDPSPLSSPPSALAVTRSNRRLRSRPSRQR